MKLKSISGYWILNSGGKPAVEVELVAYNGIRAIASAPSAIKAGRREVHQTDMGIDLSECTETIMNELEGKELDQLDIDKILKNHMDIIGSDVALSISLAFAKLCALEKQKSLSCYIRGMFFNYSKRCVPTTLATIFSGGVHNSRKAMQNIMVAVNANSFTEIQYHILKIYNDVEDELLSKGILTGYGKSSGMIVNELTDQEKIHLLSEKIEHLNLADSVSIALDVAAEHLETKQKGFYEYEGKIMSGFQLFEMYKTLIDQYPITYIEDPFESADFVFWKQLNEYSGKIAIVGDDLFATQRQFLSRDLANTVLIKMNQAGTLSDTIITVQYARELGMCTCVSHRSLETEETFMCDLSAAIGSEYIKIGGPRRGDRIAKYNQMIRLERNGDLGYIR